MSSPSDFFPPTPQAFRNLRNAFNLITLGAPLGLTSLSQFQLMGKTSGSGILYLPGRCGWCMAELIGPINFTFIMFTLPQKLHPPPNSSTSLLGTGLPLNQELLFSLYLLHYANRAIISPLIFAPSMSPIHIWMVMFMAVYQFMNSSCLASWLVYSYDTAGPAFPTIPSLLALGVFLFGMIGNIAAEHTLFDLRRGAAKRKAKSEGKAQITFDKVYVIPPANGWFKYMLYPHYVLEWLEWTGYWLLGGSLALGWKTPALWFVLSEIITMGQRALNGKKWYTEKFGKRAVGKRGSVSSISWL